ncbi:MAG: hypothetical protein K8963_02185 [Proteobacteria bacterium]|nr:hypothetical protein [Pseudomonadota bacterium]
MEARITPARERGGIIDYADASAAQHLAAGTSVRTVISVDIGIYYSTASASASRRQHRQR